VCEARATDPPLETPSMIFSLLYCICTMFCVFMQLKLHDNLALAEKIFKSFVRAKTRTVASINPF